MNLYNYPIPYLGRKKVLTLVSRQDKRIILNEQCVLNFYHVNNAAANWST